MKFWWYSFLRMIVKIILILLCCYSVTIEDYISFWFTFINIKKFRFFDFSGCFSLLCQTLWQFQRSQTGNKMRREYVQVSPLDPFLLPELVSYRAFCCGDRLMWLGSKSWYCSSMPKCSADDKVCMIEVMGDRSKDCWTKWRSWV